MARSGFLRVKPHTQIAVELITVELTNMTKEAHISADTALWNFIAKCRPDLAKAAVEKAREEGKPPPDDALKAIE